MKIPVWIAVLFFAMVLAQWIIPGQMIFTSQKVLTAGIPFAFKCAPVDPNDPFRGKYVTLNFDASDFRTYDYSRVEFLPGETVYLKLYKGRDGYARVKSVSKQKPALSDTFMQANVSYMQREADDLLIALDFPFTRFYLNEQKAPAAENLYREKVADDNTQTYALVYVYKGNARIRDVIIGDTSLLQRLRKNEKQVVL